MPCPGAAACHCPWLSLRCEVRPLRFGIVCVYSGRGRVSPSGIPVPYSPFRPWPAYASSSSGASRWISGSDSRAVEVPPRQDVQEHSLTTSSRPPSPGSSVVVRDHFLSPMEFGSASSQVVRKYKRDRCPKGSEPLALLAKDIPWPFPETLWCALAVFPRSLSGHVSGSGCPVEMPRAVTREHEGTLM